MNADRHLKVVERTLADQEALVARLQRAGVSSQGAEQYLNTLRATLESGRRYRDQVAAELARRPT
jgi:hypothetical protein